MKVISLLMLLVACSSTHEEDKVLPLKRKLRQCYVESDSYTGMAGAVQGQILMKVILDPEGKVVKAEIEKSDFKDPNLHACVRSVFKMSTIENKTGAVITKEWPVNFEEVRR